MDVTPLIWVVGAIIVIFCIVVARGAPYVPSHRRYVRAAFRELYPVGEKDVLVDVGSGDGVILRLAAERGARAVGYEINPILVAITWLLSRGNRKISVKLADFWLTPLPNDTTIVYAFTVTRDIEKIAKKMQQEAIAKNRQLWLMTYGSEVTSRKPVKRLKAHSLFSFEPLQRDKA